VVNSFCSSEVSLFHLCSLWNLSYSLFLNFFYSYVHTMFGPFPPPFPPLPPSSPSTPH
jgi:hypothetical protein